MIKLLFPAFVLTKEYLGKDKCSEITPEYMVALKEEIDAMRKRNPTGRNVSNRNGWQSIDGIERNPIFIRALRQIKRAFRDELVPFLGIEKNTANIELHNSWANINYPGAWNAPHLHNGCFYSGVFFIHADGDEGDFRAVDTDHKIVSNFPHTQQRIWESWAVRPRTGDLYLFPSGLMHMVEPNLTEKDRYSISFNWDVTGGKERENIKNPGLEFEVDENGDLIY
mgnify:FL=1|tara:strand:- start:1127 stop:1801 length:675 start_codon:yes stop_codon:yes gene_type:complete